MRDVGRYPVMTPTQERALGTELMALRQGYWQAVLSYPPYCAAALEVIGEQLQQRIPADDFARLEQAAQALRSHNRKANREEFQRALFDLTGRLALIDPECLGAERIAADVEQLEAGVHRGLSMKITPPRKNSQPFRDYLRGIRRASLALRAVRHRFARANLRLVVRIASRFQRTALSLHDRVQEGNLGLMKAVDRFDPSRGFRFSTYASWWIKHAIRRAAANRGRTVRLPAHLQATSTRLSKVRGRLRGRLEREPTLQEVADEAELTVDKVEACVQAMRQHRVSLESQVSEYDDRTLADTLFDPEELPLDERLALTAETGRVHGQLLYLSPMERDILCQRFGLNGATPRTLTEIGQQYSLSRERIRQLQQKALSDLRGRME